MFLSPGSRAQRNKLIAPRGTTMLFIQAAAPAGWTRVTANDDSILRVNGSTTPATGGTNGFVSVFNSQTTTGGHTLTQTELPNPSLTSTNLKVDASSGTATGLLYGTSGAVLQSVVNTPLGGSGVAHTHTITTSIKYVDSLVAKKN